MCILARGKITLLLIVLLLIVYRLRCSLRPARKIGSHVLGSRYRSYVVIG